MKELVTLLYGSLTALGEQAKHNVLRTSHSKRVAERALRGQLYLDELRREHLGWRTAHCQEWGFFLLKCLLHNAAAMWRREWERTTRRHPQAQ